MSSKRRRLGGVDEDTPQLDGQTWWTTAIDLSHRGFKPVQEAALTEVALAPQPVVGEALEELLRPFRTPLRPETLRMRMG